MTASPTASGKSLRSSARLAGPYHLEPMNAYERRIVHNRLQGRPGDHDLEPAGRRAIKRITLKRRPTATPPA
jgi:predicted RNA-binding protein Jag